MDILVLDLEATCWENERYPDNQEIIEIGAILLDSNYNVLDTFEEFIRPVKNPELSDYCRTLTNITQSDVEKSYTFEKVYRNFVRWVSDRSSVVRVYSWGDFDKKLMKKQHEEFFDSNFDFEDWKDLSASFREVFKRKRKYGMKKAMRFLNLEMTGQHHRALPDAVNAAKIVPHIEARKNSNKIESCNYMRKENV